MPKEAFYRLGESKKSQLDQVLFNVFSTHHISQVKVSDIVGQMNMARGSFYNYFEDLADAHEYVVRDKYMKLHRKIMEFIYQKQTDLFAGIEDYLRWISNLDEDSQDFKDMVFLLTNDSLRSYKRIPIAANSENSQYQMIDSWMKIVAENNFTKIQTKEEGMTFLFFLMELVTNCMKTYLANSWNESQLICDYQLKVSWLKSGIL